MKSIKPAIFYALLSLLWAGISIYAKAWFMLIFTIVPIIFMALEIHEYRLSRKYYKKFLQEERAKLGLTDKPIETEDPEIIEDDEDDEEYAEYLEYAAEMEELEKFDADSGKGYCPHCGNYGVNDEKLCEACGERVTE